MDRNAGLAQRTPFAERAVPWTRKAVERRLGEAMDVVCCLPNKEYRMLRGGGVNWPEVVLEFADRVGRRAVNGRTRVRPGARAIARADEALQWFLWM